MDTESSDRSDLLAYADRPWLQMAQLAPTRAGFVENVTGVPNILLEAHSLVTTILVSLAVFDLSQAEKHIIPHGYVT